MRSKLFLFCCGLCVLSRLFGCIVAHDDGRDRDHTVIVEQPVIVDHSHDDPHANDHGPDQH